MPSPAAPPAPLWHSAAFTLWPDAVTQGAYTAKALSGNHLESDYPGAAGAWQASLDVADLPQYTSPFPLLDALYNLALEEARRAVEPDDTFRTGQEWAGVWTRDISYSIILAQALLQPDVAKTSLLRKLTPHGRIVQDTGTGGAWPCSTDRVIWAVAAWEIFLVTGDEAWLRQVYPAVQQTLADDALTVYDPQTGLVRGESSFLDWREQTYPAWMQPADIFQSECLGTNAVHAQAQTVAALMAEHLGETAAAEQHRRQAARIRAAINEHLWLPDKGYYGQFRYGRCFPLLSPRAEALGAALSILFDVAPPERQRPMVARMPVTAFGIPCIYPQIPDVPPYHNAAVWPFVQSFWGLAAAKAGHAAAFMASLAAVARPAALFLTNKENFVVDSGDFAGTQVNSSVMLWSISGALGLLYKGLFGMEFRAEGLRFRPLVPPELPGPHRLSGLRYRQATLDIELRGTGRHIGQITLDGQPLPDATVPATLAGPHRLRIELTNDEPAGELPAARPRPAPNRNSPATPQVRCTDGRLRWPAVPGAAHYLVLRNGETVARTAETYFGVPTPAAYAEYQVLAVDAAGLLSFASEPLPVEANRFRRLYELAPLVEPAARSLWAGASGQGCVEISSTRHRRLAVPVHVPATGLYAIDFRYANGNGPINTGNACALRTLRAGLRPLGTVVLPQRGTEAWADWGYSNPVLAHLSQGHLTLTLTLEPANENMNGLLNQAMLDHLRLTRLR